MANVLQQIDERLSEWVSAQGPAFVAAAPASASEPVEVDILSSPDTLELTGPRSIRVALGGESPVRASLEENGRIVVMLCAFAGGPRTVRFHGSASVADGFADVTVERIADSCGFVVPKLDLQSRDSERLGSAGPPETPSELDERLAGWISEQHLFFVASAPAGPDGHVNLSPKGAMDSLAVLGPTSIGYVDFFGSGIETVAHIKENGRLTMMLCGLGTDGAVLRLSGRGRVLEIDDPDWAAMRPRFGLAQAKEKAERSIVLLDVGRVEHSEAALPAYRYVAEREQLFRSADNRIRKQGPDAIRAYCRVNNDQSIDGLRGVSPSSKQPTPEERAALAHEGRKL